MATPLVVHAHFYQPPRENPWTGTVEPEPGAAPFHDWNERIHAECYRPNAWARVFDRRGRVADIVNNYSLLSFDVGPTLLSWLQAHHPDTYGRIVEADGGHRGMAQAYNHAILPLCNDRDRRTQVLWGLADFRHRFGREAEGLWLPETAADEATLVDLIDCGVRFTVLAPSQAAAPVDLGRPYRFDHPDGSGRSIALFFYDGALSRAVAFEKALATSEIFVDRLARAANGGLTHLATDGETYGHHHTWADRTLAFALSRLAPERGFEVTSYQRYLADHPARDPVRIVSPSAWSCVHGVGRWERDCGCATGGEERWNQAWRGPLRAALDVLRDKAVACYEALAPDVMVDPWAARDAYVDVVLGLVPRPAFCDLQAGRALTRPQRVRALTLLEMQRHAMLMYTSCGWFFNDLAGIETVQVLKYAARVVQLMEEIGDTSPRSRFLGALTKARSNRPEEGDGAQIFQRRVGPVQASADRIAAHLALLFIADNPPEDGIVGQWRVRQWSATRKSHGRVALATGHVQVESLTTGRRLDCASVALYLGGIDFWGALVPFVSEEDLERRSRPLWDAFEHVPLPQLFRLAREAFPGEEFGLEKALPDGVQQIIQTVFSDLVEKFAVQYERLYDDHHRILELLRRTGFQMPRELTAAAEFTLSRRLESEIEEHADRFDREALARAIEIAETAGANRWHLDTSRAEVRLSSAVTQAVAHAVRTRRGKDVDAALALLDLATDLGLRLNLDRAQETVFGARSPSLATLARRLHVAMPGD